MGKDYDDYCKSLDKHSEALDRNSKMGFLLYTQQNEARSTPVIARFGTLPLDGHYQLTPRWQQLVPRNSSRKEITIIPWGGDTTDSLVICDNDNIDVVTVVRSLLQTNPSSATGIDGAPLSAMIVNVASGGTQSGQEPNNPITIPTTEPLYVASVNVSTDATDPIIGGNGNVGWVESIYNSAALIPQQQADDRPKAGQLLKPSQEVQRVVGDIEKEVAKHDLD